LAEIYLIADDLPGQLWIMPCPEAETFEASLGIFRDRGVDTVVSLLPTSEMADLGVLGEPEYCKACGIEFISHPIADFGLPEKVAFADLTTELATLLRAGHSVAVHCRAGIGRSGMTTAGALIALGYSSRDAIAKVACARGVSIPDTVEQATFIADLAKSMKSGDRSSI
jgi:protein-tyrosine phosphatase